MPVGTDTSRQLAAYQHSVVTVRLKHGDVLLTVGKPPAATVPTPSGIITAMNPQGVASVTVIARAAPALHAVLHRRQFAHVPTVSQAIDGSHKEEGFLVSGITQDTLCQLGRAFGQLAVYWITDENVQVVACR